MIFRTLFIISILVSAAVAKGQQVQVINSSDRTPIENVAVFNITRERAAITDSLGMIDISIFPDSDTIIFQHPSYLTKRYSRSEITGQHQVLLQRKRILFDEYVISASNTGRAG